GYEGAGLADLAEAMGISRKSMYAAFGNREQLFRKALQRHTEGPGAFLVQVLQASTAREVAAAPRRLGCEPRPGPDAPLGAWACRARWPSARPGRSRVTP
ncbi:TetR/AcrR family transcriptional regulator, partial [Streptomyces scopuliridis]|uniref:TetR/AcrR family transcriptional regulator n=1 Tax=Streptomyces scopuliridis TaxID=452529 RepID=UPI00369E1CED